MKSKATYYVYQPAGCKGSWRWSIYDGYKPMVTRNNFESRKDAIQDMRSFLKKLDASLDFNLTDVSAEWEVRFGGIDNKKS